MLPSTISASEVPLTIACGSVHQCRHQESERSPKGCLIVAHSTRASVVWETCRRGGRENEALDGAEKPTLRAVTLSGSGFRDFEEAADVCYPAVLTEVCPTFPGYL